jgi:hypothetical protein
VGVLAVSRWPVYMSGMVKPYSGDLFCSCALMALAVRWERRPERLWPLALLAAIVPLALGSSYPTIFVAGAVALYLIPSVHRSPRIRAKLLFAAYALFMVASFLGIYLLTARQKLEPDGARLAAFMHDYWSHGFPPAEPLKFISWAALTHTGRMLAFPIGDSNGASALTFLLFAFGIWRCARSGQYSLLVLCLTPFALNFAAAMMEKYPYGACCRLSQHLAPAICLFIGTGWAALIERCAQELLKRLRYVWRTAIWSYFCRIETVGVLNCRSEYCRIVEHSGGGDPAGSD